MNADAHGNCIAGTASKVTQAATICLVMISSLLLGAVLVGGVMKPGEAYAGYSSLSGAKSTCITNGCHSNVSTTGSLTTAINRIPATEVTVAPGNTIEVDWMFSIRGNTGEFSSGTTFTTPIGWTVASGTSNAPALAGWSSAWDLANGVGWNTNPNLKCSDTGVNCFAIDYAGSLWDSGPYDVACDNGLVCSQGSDLDGIQNRMGTDARITIPSNAAISTTPYLVKVYAVGHDAKKKNLNIKTNKFQPVSVLVLAPGTTVVGDGIAPANKTVFGSDIHRTVSTFTLSANAVDTVTQISVTGSGNGLANVAAAKLWKDTGSIPNEWDLGDTQIGTAQLFSASVATFSGLSESVSNIPVKYLVTYDIIGTPVAVSTILGTVTGLIATNTVQNLDSPDATLTVPAVAAAIPFVSVTTGNWNNPATWDRNLVPTFDSKVIISAGHTITTNVATAALGELTVNGTLSVGAFTITVNGPTTINGTLAHNSATGVKTYTGLVTINPGGTWSNTANAAITLRGGLTNNSSNAFTAGSGTYTFTTNSQFIGGTNATSIQNVIVSGVTLTNTGTLTVGSTLTGTGGLSNAGTLNIGGTAGITTLESTNSTSTVNFNAAGAQTVVAGIYNNLTLSGSGAKTLQSGVFPIGGNLTVDGTASTVSVEDTVIDGNLVVGDGAGFTAAGFGLHVNGTTTAGGGTNGRLTIASASGVKTFDGLVTLNTGAIWENSSANSPVSFGGGIRNNGIFNAGTGVYTFGTTAQSVFGTLSIPNVTATGTLTNNGALTVGTALSGSGTLIQAPSSTLTIGATSGITALVASANDNSVNYSGGVQTIRTIAYHNLILSGSGTKTIGAGTSVTGILSIAPTGTAKALIGTGLSIDVAGTLTLGGVNQSSGTWGSSSSTAYNKNDTFFAASSGIVNVQGVPPTFSSAASTSFTYGTASIFTVVAIAVPPATITKTGSLPVGVSFKDNGDGTATIGGTPNSSGTYPLNISAVNNYGSATQAFALTVTPRDTSTTSAVDTEISVSPNRHLFGVVTNIPACGSPLTFTVRNAGSTSRTLGALSLGGYDAAQYSIGANTCNGATLATGQTCTVGVSFCPNTTGSKSAYLQIPSNDLETPILTAMLYNHESLDEEAARRLPPVLQNLDIPPSCQVAGQSCTIKWSLLGYDEDYLSRLIVINCAGAVAGTCGDNGVPILRDSGNMSSITTTTGAWSYTNVNTVNSKKFDYSYTFTTPAAGPVVLRMYRKNIDDAAAGLGGPSLLIPGNQNQAGISYYDNQGRRLQYQIQ